MQSQFRKILVHGANGVQGSAIARRLREEGFGVRSGVRDLVRAGAGSEAVAADLGDPAALARASAGVDAVVLTLPLDFAPGRALRWTENAVAAAREGGARLVVLNTSARLPPEVTGVASFEARREIEAAVRAAGLPFIGLRPPFYMENLAGPWVREALQRDRVLGYPVPAALAVAWLSVADLGSFVVAALRRPDLAGAFFDVGGPEALDGPAAAHAVGAAIGQPLRYASIPPAAFEQALAGHFGPEVAREIAASYFWIEAHVGTRLLARTGADEALMGALPRPLLTLAAWAEVGLGAPTVR